MPSADGRPMTVSGVLGEAKRINGSALRSAQNGRHERQTAAQRARIGGPVKALPWGLTQRTRHWRAATVDVSVQ